MEARDGGEPRQIPHLEIRMADVGVGFGGIARGGLLMVVGEALRHLDATIDVDAELGVGHAHHLQREAKAHGVAQLHGSRDGPIEEDGLSVCQEEALRPFGIEAALADGSGTVETGAHRPVACAIDPRPRRGGEDKGIIFHRSALVGAIGRQEPLFVEPRARKGEVQRRQVQTQVQRVTAHPGERSRVVVDRHGVVSTGRKRAVTTQDRRAVLIELHSTCPRGTRDGQPNQRDKVGDTTNAHGFSSFDPRQTLAAQRSVVQAAMGFVP